MRRSRKKGPKSPKATFLVHRVGTIKKFGAVSPKFKESNLVRSYVLFCEAKKLVHRIGGPILCTSKNSRSLIDNF